MIALKQPIAKRPKRNPLMLLPAPQNRAREKKQLVMYSQSQARHKKALISPRGPAIRRASAKKNIFVPLPAIALQSRLYIVDELEKGRLTRLLVASILAYLAAALASYFLMPILGDLSRVDIFLRYRWMIGVAILIGFVWMPLSVWTFFQGWVLRKQSRSLNLSEDLSIPSLAIAIPICMWFTYISTRLIY